VSGAGNAERKGPAPKGDSWRSEDDARLARTREVLCERMRRTFGEDRHKVRHALAVLRVAERIGAETGADPQVLVPAAILHDIGRAIPSADPDAAHGEGGRRLARDLLADLDLSARAREEILELVEHHHERRAMDTPNGAPLFDADLIVNLGEAGAPDRRQRLAREALTEPARRIGAEML
jgi:putative nucleotidyltransferase with HDIG domain